MVAPLWGLWWWFLLPPLLQGGAAAAAFLPFSAAEGIFRAFGNLLEPNQGSLASEPFDDTVDIGSLPPNYHNEEDKERKMGNATLYSHREIHKVTDNRTGEIIFSEKTVTSLEQGDGLPEKKEACVNDDNCQKDQFCFRSLLASRCQPCKAKGVTCREDGECCLGCWCVWGQCAEGMSPGESGTRCGPNREECAPGLCCTTSGSSSLPVCMPYPTEGEACQAPGATFLGLMMGWGSPAASAKSGESCPCAQGLQCRRERYAVPTCEKPEDSVDTHRLGQQPPVFQPVLMNRDTEAAAYYDDSSRQDGRLAMVALPRGPSYVGDAEPGGDYGEEKRPALWEEGDREEPNPSDSQELEQLADQMGQYFGPGFY